MCAGRANIGGFFANHNVSLRSVVQEGGPSGGSVEIILLTHTACEKNVRASLEELAGMPDMLVCEPTLIRVEE